MSDALDQAALEAAIRAYDTFEGGPDSYLVKQIVRAYLSAARSAPEAGKAVDGPKPLAPMRERVEYTLSEDERFLYPGFDYIKVADGRCTECGASLAARHADDPNWPALASVPAPSGAIKIDDVDRDMIARGDRIGADLQRALLKFYDDHAIPSSEAEPKAKRVQHRVRPHKKAEWGPWIDGYVPKDYLGWFEQREVAPQAVPADDVATLADEDAPPSKTFALPLRLGKGTQHEAPIFDRHGELVGECVDDDCEERALAFIRAVNRSPTVKELYASVRVLQLSLKQERDWRSQFDCCMCGSRMNDHDIGSGHSPVSMYDYNQDRLQAALTASEAEATSLRRKLEGAERERDDWKATHGRVVQGFAEVCEAVGVQFDAPDAVAYAINAKIGNAEHDLRVAERKLEEHRKALEPFGKWLDALDTEFADHADDVIAAGIHGSTVTFGDLRRARTLSGASE